MITRMDLKRLNPAGFKAMLAFDSHLAEGDLTTAEQNLIKIRASQLNGCSYCVAMHSHEARETGETEKRIYCLSLWRDTTLFTQEEQALLALTEEVTQISGRVSDKTYTTAVSVLGERKVAQAIMAIIVINSWNRIGVATEMMPD